MDGFVIDVPKPIRWFLVNVIIVPRRKEFQSARAYQKVQLPEGSPLLVYTRALAENVAARLALMTSVTWLSTRCVTAILRSRASLANTAFTGVSRNIVCAAALSAVC